MLYLDWRFLPVYDQIDPTTAHTGGYDFGLVALSIVVATLAAFVALSISGRIVASNGKLFASRLKTPAPRAAT